MWRTTLIHATGIHGSDIGMPVGPEKCSCTVTKRGEVVRGSHYQKVTNIQVCHTCESVT